MTRECDSYRLNNQRLRDNLMRMEKDRNALELKLKSANGTYISHYNTRYSRSLNVPMYNIYIVYIKYNIVKYTISHKL